MLRPIFGSYKFSQPHFPDHCLHSGVVNSVFHYHLTLWPVVQYFVRDLKLTCSQGRRHAINSKPYYCYASSENWGLLPVGSSGKSQMGPTTLSPAAEILICCTSSATKASHGEIVKNPQRKTWYLNCTVSRQNRDRQTREHQSRDRQNRDQMFLQKFCKHCKNVVKMF